VSFADAGRRYLKRFLCAVFTRTSLVRPRLSYRLYAGDPKPPIPRGTKCRRVCLFVKRWRRGRTEYGFQQILRSLTLFPGIGAVAGVFCRCRSKVSETVLMRRDGSYALCLRARPWLDHDSHKQCAGEPKPPIPRGTKCRRVCLFVKHCRRGRTEHWFQQIFRSLPLFPGIGAVAARANAGGPLPILPCFSQIPGLSSFVREGV
jgi:hypothetical protein